MSDSADVKIIDSAIRFLLLALFLYSTLIMIAPMAGIVVWAVILCVAIYPLFDWLQHRFGERKGLAALLLVLCGLALTLGPIAGSMSVLVQIGTEVFGLLETDKLNVPPPPQSLQDIPVIGLKLHQVWQLFERNLEQALLQYSSLILEVGKGVFGKVAGVGISLLGMTLSVIIMGLMLPSGLALVQSLQKIANRVFAPRGGEFITIAGATVRNVSRGIIGVAALQALVAGSVMAMFGISAAGPLAIACLILSIIQIGPGLILLPVIIWAWGDMSTGQAFFFTVLMLPVALMDNFLRPIFIAKGLQTPMLVILIGVLGGMLAYGLIGLFIGPVILAVFYELFIVWMDSDNAAKISGTQTDKAQT